MKRVLQAFPGLVMDAAHLGGWGVWGEACELLGEERCFFDVSSTLAFLEPGELRNIVRRYGAERVMFGSDFPIWSPLQELETLEAAGFSSEELELMLSANCERFLRQEL